jgi:TPR repeat protein
MRTFECIAVMVVVGACIGLGRAFGLDGGHSIAGPSAPVECAATMRSAATPAPTNSLQYAAEQDNPVAQWKLGRMYARGEGVPRCDLRAFEYFSQIANSHAEDYPNTPQAPFVAYAFVALGQYYLDGIANSNVKADAGRARQMFFYAASYFGNADAQYHLARIYLDGRGVDRDPKLAARWLGLAAKKGQTQAQAVLGQMLFKGDMVPRQAARGLMWLTLARDGAGPDDKWIADLYDSAFKQANDDDRAIALTYLERWLKTQRE